MNSVIDGRAKTARKILTNSHSSNGIGLVYQEAMRRAKGQGHIKVLDFGCGYGQSKDLLQGVNDRLIWFGHDLVDRLTTDDSPYEPFFSRDELHNLHKWCDMVLLSNVINVQETWMQLEETVTLALSCVKYGGQLLWNYPRAPRKMACDTADMKRLIWNHVRLFRPDVQLVYVS